MSDGIILTTSAFEKLLKCLVDLEEGYKQLLDIFYPEMTKERFDFIDFITGYIDKLNATVKNVIFDDNCDDHFPFAIIGSCVELFDLEDGQTYSYHIVRPEERDIEKGYISFLSPVGMALLLKKAGDTISVSTPQGVYRYRIKTIILK